MNGKVVAICCYMLLYVAIFMCMYMYVCMCGYVWMRDVRPGVPAGVPWAPALCAWNLRGRRGTWGSARDLCEGEHCHLYDQALHHHAFGCFCCCRVLFTCFHMLVFLSFALKAGKMTSLCLCLLQSDQELTAKLAGFFVAALNGRLQFDFCVIFVSSNYSKLL